MRTALATLVLVAACAKPPGEFGPRLAELRRVAILPPEVQLVRILFAGDDEPMLAEADLARRELVTAIAPELQAHGFVVRPARLDDADAPSADLRYRLTVARGQHATLLQDLTAGKAARGFGPNLGALADHAEVDTVLLVNLVGVTKSGGQVARDLAVSVLTLGSVIYKTSATRLFVTLVHGTTGEVLWWSWRRVDESAFDGASLEALVHDVFERMPTLPAAGGGDGTGGGAEGGASGVGTVSPPLSPVLTPRAGRTPAPPAPPR